MNTGKTPNRLMGAGVFSALAASLCCIVPLLALLAGSTGMAASFSWMEPARPYLIGISIAILGLAWWQKLRPKTKEELDCECEEDGNPSVWYSKRFLGIVTVFAALMLAFPYYTHMFYPGSQPDTQIQASENLLEAECQVSGMTCRGCEEYIKQAVSQMPGFIATTVSYKEGSARIQYDSTLTHIDEILKVINKTGFTVTEYKMREK